ncbi:MAG TPA: 16S rRNA (cytidine(1402)-2'-O)-methyltransferase [Candidatus Paceibacterota bacterium]|nr:16S rRNA (cytidine(1402)-2'-O)-methyltransferase [Candidatus Paceibacterota bacterium]
MGTLYIVATPIGNLEDITLRAVRVLCEVDLILCEDTRMTKRLMDKYDIKKPVKTFNSHSTAGGREDIYEMLSEGKNIALVTDAGTPGISDPGSFLVAEVREKFGDEIKITPVPGASALTTALSASGVPASDFLFLGFLPHKKGRQTLMKEIATSERTVVFYESPHRILKALAELSKFVPQRKITIARELTKIYEEYLSGTPEELSNLLKSNSQKQKGEFVVIVSA